MFTFFFLDYFFVFRILKIRNPLCLTTKIILEIDFERDNSAYHYDIHME